MGPSRREFTWMMTAGGLLMPRLARPAAPAGDRRFLFVFCDGGWDQTTVFAPTFDAPDIPDEAGATPAQVGDVTFTDHAERPSVRAFLERYSDRCCIFNGFEVRSVAHLRCLQIAMTGNGEAGRDDWAALIAGHATDAPLLPCLVASGPSYATTYANQVVRLGETGQLSSLLDASAVPMNLPPSQDAERTVDAFVRSAASGHATTAPPGGQRLADAYVDALDRLGELQELSSGLDLSVDPSKQLTDKLLPVLTCFELGLARTAVVKFRGVNEAGFDTHSDNRRQSGHFELLFEELGLLMDEMEARTGPAGGTLADEVVIVLLSEMGRTPTPNRSDGKDHWTWTSAMLIGPGVQGGNVGAFDDWGIGQPVDPATGQPSSSGVKMTAEHLGASLLTLAGVDSAEWLPGVDPILGALR